MRRMRDQGLCTIDKAAHVGTQMHFGIHIRLGHAHAHQTAQSGRVRAVSESSLQAEEGQQVTRPGATQLQRIWLLAYVAAALRIMPPTAACIIEESSADEGEGASIFEA